LHPWEFGEYTLREFILRRKGLHEARRKQLREDYQHTRILAYHMILPYLDKSAKRKPIDQIVPDLYDDDNPAKVISLKDRYKELLEKYEKAGVMKDGLIVQPKKAAKSGK
jgi:hypothetical protein